VTDIQTRTLTMLTKHGPIGPAALSGFVWPDREIALRKGAAPGTGLVRPMLAVLARLRKAGHVDWGSSRDEPVQWYITTAGCTALGVSNVPVERLGVY
jgi:hypothetical protein